MRKIPLFRSSKQIEKELRASLNSIKHKEPLSSLNKTKFDISKSIEKDNFANSINTTAKLDTDFQRFVKGFTSGANPNVIDYSNYANNPMLADNNRRLT